METNTTPLAAVEMYKMFSVKQFAMTPLQTTEAESSPRQLTKKNTTAEQEKLSSSVFHP